MADEFLTSQRLRLSPNRPSRRRTEEHGKTVTGVLRAPQLSAALSAIGILVQGGERDDGGARFQLTEKWRSPTSRSSSPAYAFPESDSEFLAAFLIVHRGF